MEPVEPPKQPPEPQLNHQSLILLEEDSCGDLWPECRHITGGGQWGGGVLSNRAVVGGGW